MLQRTAPLIFLHIPCKSNKNLAISQTDRASAAHTIRWGHL